MWRFLIPLVLGHAHAQFTIPNITSCTQDALYTSLVNDGIDFCLSVIEHGHCGGGYSTPTQYATYNQTRISSSCKCIFTDHTSTATSADSAKGTWANPPPITRDDGFSRTTVQSTAAISSLSGKGPVPSVPSVSRFWNSSSSIIDPASATGGTSSTAISGSGLEVPGTGTGLPSSLVGTAVPTSIVGTAVPTSLIGTGVSTSQIGTAIHTSLSGKNDLTSIVGTAIPTSLNKTLVPTSIIGTTNSSRTAPNASSTVATGSSAILISTTGRISMATTPWTPSPAPTGDQPSNSSAHVSETFRSMSGSGNSTSSPVTSKSSALPGASSTAQSTFGDWNSSSSASRVSRPVIPSSSSISLGTGVSTSGKSTRTSIQQSTTTSAPSSSGVGPALTTATPTFLTPTSSFNNTSSTIGNATSTGAPEFPAANFTHVTRTAAVSQETCYQLPKDAQGDPTHRALMRNFQLRERNASIPYPYIESIDFESDGIDPLYLTVRDAIGGSYHIDISNKSHIAIVDSSGNSLLLDAEGIHFATSGCRHDVSICVSNLYKQLSDLSGVDCSTGGRQRRMEDMEFRQVLFLRDQCGNPINRSVRRYPQLRVGDTPCNDIRVNEFTGRWEFDCTFPGSDSSTLKCQRAVKNDVVDFLLKDPFGGACPDLSTVITTLEASGQDFMSPDSLYTELYNQGVDGTEKGDVDKAVDSYAQLWEALRQVFSTSKSQASASTSAIENYISLYNQYRDFEDDICEDLHAAEIPLKLNLVAGATTIDALTTLNWAPETTAPYNLTIQDPSRVACCDKGSVADNDGDTCKYPSDALIADTGCICGQTATGQAIAFEETECDNFVSQCESDQDCASGGFVNFVCLTGTCCGGGVCIDPYACSQNGTVLVRI